MVIFAGFLNHQQYQSYQSLQPFQGPKTGSKFPTRVPQGFFSLLQNQRMGCSAGLTSKHFDLNVILFGNIFLESSSRTSPKQIATEHLRTFSGHPSFFSTQPPKIASPQKKHQTSQTPSNPALAVFFSPFRDITQHRTPKPKNSKTERANSVLETKML